MARVALACARELADADARPTFVATPPAGARRARLGIFPDRERTEPGVGVSDAVADGPAARAGIRAGDVILAVGGQETKTLRDLVGALGAQEPGATVEVRLRRATGAVETIEVELGGGHRGGRRLRP